jgi:hypothetical protein
MPRLSERQPPDLLAFQRLLKDFYDAYSDPPAGSNRPRLSKARVSIACGMQDPAWLNKVISGAPGCKNFRTETLVRFANVLSLSIGDRKRLARVADRPFALFAPAVLSRSLDTISMRRALLLRSAQQPHEAAEAVKALVSDVPKVSLRLSRVFGVHDMILRVTIPPGSLVLPDVVDRVRYSVASITTDTLLLRDDLKLVVHGPQTKTLSKFEERRSAYVFFENASSSSHDKLIAAMIEAARPLAITLLTAAVLVGRFDAVAEIAVDRLNYLDGYIRNLGLSLPKAPTTVTYPAVQVLQELSNTQW